ncbi:MAG: CHAD domain-containing protein [Paracoccaceae bacterium]
MAYAFDRRGEAVPRAARRIASRLLSQGAADLRAGEAQGIHTARKSIKKTRALLRLLRDRVEGFDAANAALRDIGRGISASRDAEVLPLTVAALSADAAPPLRASLSRLLVPRGPVSDAARDTALADAAARLEAMAAAAPDWTISGKGFAALEPGLTRAWHKARQAADRARRGDPEAIHDWRKRVKDHWYHARLLTPIWPAMMTAHAAAVGEIGERLGDRQDIAVLLARLGAADLPADDAEAVRAHAVLHADRLEAAARTLADRLFAEDAEALVRRWAAWWRLWQADR